LSAGPRTAAAAPEPRGQGGELVEVLLAGDLRTVEPGQGGLLDPRGVFAGDDEGVFDLTGVDHVRGQGHAVDEAEAGVGDVEVHRLRAQADAGMDADGHGRLQVLTRDRGVDHQADRLGGDARLGEGLPSRGDRALGELMGLIPVAARVDAGDTLEQALRQPEGGQRIGEAFVEFL
jgi:hypothetical protein